MFADRRNRPNAPADITPLHMAIYKQYPEIAILLIEKGARIDVKDQFGLTPFMICAMRSKLIKNTCLNC
jgi:ankyrin repeat protein